MSIKILALDLTFSLINEENVKSIVKELLNYLIICEKEII
jgi:hypothetical protein